MRTDTYPLDLTSGENLLIKMQVTHIFTESPASYDGIEREIGLMSPFLID